METLQSHLILCFVHLEQKGLHDTLQYPDTRSDQRRTLVMEKSGM